jgi:hypothetical protein
MLGQVTMKLPFDQLVLSVIVLILVGGGMRLFYGAWPWEIRKTWYRTRQAVDFVEALRNETGPRSGPALTESSANTYAPRLTQGAIGSSGDSFDRSVVFENSSHDMTPPPENSAVFKEVALQKSSEKPSITRRGWLISSRRRQTVQNTKTALPGTGDSDGGDWVAR